MERTLYSDIDCGITNILDGRGTEVLEFIMEDMLVLWESLAKEEQDYRGGEVYGYDTGTIENTLKYISDRWRCSFRLKWLIDGVQQTKFKILERG